VLLLVSPRRSRCQIGQNQRESRSRSVEFWGDVKRAANFLTISSTEVLTDRNVSHTTRHVDDAEHLLLPLFNVH